MNAVGYQSLALEKLQRLLRPENAIADPVGNVDSAIPIQMNDASLREIEIRVMAGYNWIVENRILQFLCAPDTTRNDRVAVHRTRRRNLV